MVEIALFGYLLERENTKKRFKYELRSKCLLNYAIQSAIMIAFLTTLPFHFFLWMYMTVKFVLKQIITDISYDCNVMIIELILPTDRKRFKKVNGQVCFQVSDHVMLENCFFQTSA